MADRRRDPAQWGLDLQTPEAARIALAMAPVTAAPDGEAEMTSQLLFGEAFTVLHRRLGWAFGQSADGYAGWVPDAALGPAARPNARIAALSAILYARPDMKSRAIAALPFGALLEAAPEAQGFRETAMGGFVPAQHLVAREHAAPDWVAIAERFVGAPYLWGGRSPAGIDCSGLVQVARNAAGLSAPRDSDMQQSMPGRNVTALKRGDLVFWAGHVGVMLSPTRFLHANAHHMSVVVEPLAQAEARILAQGDGPITARRRPRA